MENKPLVSVCIPAYNGEKFIEKTLDCVLNQTYKNIRVVVIEDRSSDNTLAVAKKTADKDSRIVVVQNETNQGLINNFNKCLEYAQGDYLQILCDDDIIAPDCIEKKVEALEKNKSCAMVFSASEVRDGEDKVIMKRRCFKGDRLIGGKEMLKAAFRKHNLYGEPSNVLLRISCIEKAGKFDTRMYYAVDWEYWSRFSLTGDVYYVDEPLSYFYVRSTSETGNLITKKDKIIADDKLMVKLCLENKEMGLTNTDALLHNINGKIRLFAKTVFARLKK